MDVAWFVDFHAPFTTQRMVQQCPLARANINRVILLGHTVADYADDPAIQTEVPAEYQTLRAVRTPQASIAASGLTCAHFISLDVRASRGSHVRLHHRISPTWYLVGRQADLAGLITHRRRVRLPVSQRNCTTLGNAGQTLCRIRFSVAGVGFWLVGRIQGLRLLHDLPHMQILTHMPEAAPVAFVVDLHE